MTRKDYELIAETLRTACGKLPAGSPGAQAHYVRQVLAGEFARALRATNPRFDESRFIAACNKEQQA